MVKEIVMTKKVNGWVFHRADVPIFSGGSFVSIQFLLEGVRYTPYFTSEENAHAFAITLHIGGLDMSRYIVAEVTGIEDDGDLICDPDAQQVLDHWVKRDIRSSMPGRN